jgi:hypothetical protein
MSPQLAQDHRMCTEEGTEQSVCIADVVPPSLRSHET